MLKVFEHRSSLLQKLFKYNAKKCNSASSFSGCVQRLKSKCCIALPTDAETVRIFEETVMGGYSCVNTRMDFDTNLLLKDTKNKKVFLKTVDGQLRRFSPELLKWMRTINMEWL